MSHSLFTPFFANMQDARALVLPTKIKETLLEELAQGLAQGKERGGYLLAKPLQRNDAYMATGVLPLPDQFLGPEHVDFKASYRSTWELFQTSKLAFSDNICFEWHTHPKPVLEPQYSHEAWKTERKENNLGDIILEQLTNGTPHIHGYVKIPTQNAFHVGEDHELIIRNVAPLKIIDFEGDVKYTLTQESNNN